MRTRLMTLKPLHGLVLSCLMLPALAHADEEAAFLQKIYLSFCVKHLENYAGLRTQLEQQELPKLPAEQAHAFLHNKSGDAWPIPYKGQFGRFVMALPEGDSECRVMARGGDSSANRRWFAQMAEQAPAPLKAEALADDQLDYPLSGPAGRLSWQWASEHAPRSLVLTLITAQNAEAPIQAQVSLALTNR